MRTLSLNRFTIRQTFLEDLQHHQGLNSSPEHVGHEFVTVTPSISQTQRTSQKITNLRPLSWSQPSLVLSGQKSVATEIICIVVPRKAYGGSVNEPVTFTSEIHSLVFLHRRGPTLLPFECIKAICERKAKEWNSRQGRCVPSVNRCEDNPFVESIRHWESEKKKSGNIKQFKNRFSQLLFRTRS
ncbi:hypothetical protein TNCV_2918061 [Trichonephila clavipes]|nr:hypothetical protein TNCV_2918061 [Trichonephila clavipes]